MSEPDLHERVAGSPALLRRRQVGRILVRALGRPDITGIDAIPESGPVVLAINHRSLIDGPLVFGFVPRPVSCLVKDEAFAWGIGRILRGAGQIPLMRETVHPAPVRLCVGVLRAGGIVGVFPDGTRGDGSARATKPGVGYLALRSGARVLPVACHGTYEIVRTLRRPPVRMVLGEPIRFERYPDRRPLSRRIAAAAAETVRAALARARRRYCAGHAANGDRSEGLAA